MGLPNIPVTLDPEEVDQLNRQLSTMRHNINNHLSLIMTATELIRYKPEMRDKMVSTVSDQPKKIIEEIRRFSSEFDKALGIHRDPPPV